MRSSGKKYRWNWRKCAWNLVELATMVAGGLLIGWVFALWAMA